MENPISPIPPAPVSEGDDDPSAANFPEAVQREEEARLAMALRISDRFHLPIERVYRILGGSAPRRAS